VDEELAVEVVNSPDCAVVTLSGPLSLRTVPRITGGLGKALVDRGRVLVNLTDLRLEWTPAVNVFATVLGYAGGWPAARMVLFGADHELAAALARSLVTRTVPLAVDLDAASQRVQSRPERVRRHLDLPPEPTAPRTARALVRQACADWEIPLQTENAAALVVAELAANAVVHAGTPLHTRVELADEDLRVSVSDLRPDLPVRLIPRIRDLTGDPNRTPRHLGLHVVSALTRSWGVVQQLDTKTVWAQLPPAGATATATGPPG
jgi:anti-sigma regulatory factor (Ser/Thr protein kinase)